MATESPRSEATRLVVIRERDVVGEIVTDSKVGNPGDREKIKDPIAKEQTELRFWCKCTRKTQRSLLLAENEWREQNPGTAEKLRRSHPSHGAVRPRGYMPPPWPKRNLARREMIRTKPHRRSTLPALASTIPGGDPFVFGSHGRNRDRCWRRARPEFADIPTRYFRSASVTAPFGPEDPRFP